MFCVHFSNETRLTEKADAFYIHKDGDLRLFNLPEGMTEGALIELDEAKRLATVESGLIVLFAPAGQWQYFHAIGEDGCQVDRPKYEMKRVLEGAEGVKRIDLS